MRKSFKIITLSSLALVLVLSVLPNLLESNANKIRIQNIASQALDSDVRIDGPFDISLSRGPHLTMQNVHISEDEDRKSVV